MKVTRELSVAGARLSNCIRRVFAPVATIGPLTCFTRIGAAERPTGLPASTQRGPWPLYCEGYTWAYTG